MKPQEFVAIGVAATLSLVLAAVTYASHNRWSDARSSGALLMPGLGTQGDKIAKIEIVQGVKSVALARAKGDAWSLADRAGFPANADPVRSLLIKLSRAELVEAKTRSKDRHELLELEDPAGKEAKSRVVRLLDDKGGVLAEVVIGKKRPEAFGTGRGGTYVRKPAEQQTWLANTELDVPVSHRDWVKTTVLDLNSSKIVRASLAVPGEETMRIEKSGDKDGALTLSGIPKDKKLKDKLAIDGILRAMASIDLDDVRKLEGKATGEVSVANLELDGGLKVTQQIRKDKDEFWLSVTTSGEGDAKKSADEIASRVQGWEFRIPSGKAELILKKRADLLEPAS